MHSKSEPAAAGECPVRAGGKPKQYKNDKVYNVYSQRVDAEGQKLNPLNNMPSTAAQSPAPGQTTPLSTERVKSTIPKGGTSSTWEYPSPQMFWNAMVRKGKQGGSEAEDMDAVVAIHNNMNENTWKVVLQWEALHPAPADVEGAEAKLLRFTGRPDENSPKARLKQLLGCPEPFDRHDWIVDRAGKEVRYIIDYYHDEEHVQDDGVPKLHDADTVKSIKIDVRPALDSLDAMLDRAVRMPLAVVQNATPFQYLPLLLPKAAANPSFITPAPDAVKPLPEDLVSHRALQDETEMAAVLMKMLGQCASRREALKAASSEAEAQNAHVALTFCYAQLLTPNRADTFEKAIAAGDEQRAEASFEAMEASVHAFLEIAQTRKAQQSQQQQQPPLQLAK